MDRAKFKKVNKAYHISRRFILRVRGSNIFIAFMGLLLLSLMLSILSPHFLTVSNILNVLRQISVIGILSVGMTYVIISGGIDLSVGSVLALSAVISAILMRNGINLFLAVVVGVLVGAACGLFSGILITTRVNMPPFISTLAMMSIARGLSLVLTSGRPVYGLPTKFGIIAGGYLFGIPIPVIIMVFIYLVGYLVLSYFRVGTYYYAVGGNEGASRVAGINTKKVKLSAYVISGICCAIGGIIITSRLTSVEPLAGLGYELDAIAAVVIGGTNLYGGEGSLIGTFIGAIIIGILRNGLNLLNVSTYWQQVVIGLVIAGVVTLGALKKR